MENNDPIEKIPLDNAELKILDEMRAFAGLIFEAWREQRCNRAEDSTKSGVPPKPG